MIAAAAIKYKDIIVSMPRPNRHHNIISAIYNLWAIKTGSNGVQGFITSTGEFVDRKEGLQIARDNNQIIYKNGNDLILFSEDMW